jgi:hypothetical protein
MPFRLESLRRSTWLAGLLLLVCLMRVGMGMACAPHDIAESLAGGAHAAAEQVGDDSTSSEALTGAAAGHCLHCACHFSATLPASIGVMSVRAGEETQVHRQTLRASFAPDRELRPPIL